MNFFRNTAGRPVSFRDMSGLMNLGRPEARKLKKILREMLRSGELILTRKGLYGPAAEMNILSGRFEAHRDGYGFLIPEKPGERDIFIPGVLAMGAMNNDRVAVKIENAGRRSGRVVRILERAYARISGRLDIAREAAFVKPSNRAVPFDIYVALADLAGAKHGDRVIVEIVSYPTDKRPPAGKIIAVHRPPESPADEAALIIEEFGLQADFPRQVKEEVGLLSSKVSAVSSRKDLRDLPTVTIDGERARDFDDAVSIESRGKGYRLWVHIADVGHYVAWGSFTDIEARRRGTSVYFPDRVIPMLPRELSEDLCSLRPKEDRYAFTVEMDFDSSGARLSARFYPSLIKSDERMTYTSVKKILVDRDEAEREKYGEFLSMFELMGELCGAIRQRRLKRGSLDFDLPEPEIILDIQGNPEAVIRAERSFAHMIIEEFMVAANEAVAEYLESGDFPSLYRIHEEPDPTKLDDIMHFARAMGLTALRTLKARDFSGILDAVRGTPGEELINYMILRSLKQARYSAENAGHFGLASECYTHFTSPIRRYPDLVVHRILRETLVSGRLPEKRKNELKTMLPDMAFSSSMTERKADEAERAAVNSMRVWFMKDKVGDEFEGKIIGVTPFGLRVRLDEYYVEGFIHVSQLTDDFYQFNEKTMRLSGRNTRRSFRIGQQLKLRLDRVDMEERELVFGIKAESGRRGGSGAR